MDEIKRFKKCVARVMKEYQKSGETCLLKEANEKIKSAFFEQYGQDRIGFRLGQDKYGNLLIEKLARPEPCIS